MDITTVIGLAGSIFIAAALYSSVGHAGASGYLAVMSLFGLSPALMKPTALMLNIAVALVATTKFYRAGCFSWKVFTPFALSSVPFAFIGGRVSLPGYLYKPVVAVVLFLAAYRLMVDKGTEGELHKPAMLWVAISGAAIGLLSGLTGVGGGIFLSPLLLFAGWAETRQASGVAAAFILVNSIAALLGHYSSSPHLPGELMSSTAPAAILGGWIGSHYGSQSLPAPVIQKLLAAVLLIAGLKMLMTM